MRRTIRWTIAILVLALLSFAISWLIYMPNAKERGVWRSEAGGMLLSITPLRADMYRETSISCVHQLAFPAHLKLIEMQEGAVVDTVGDQLRLTIDGDLAPGLFNRVDALPDNCGPSNPQTATPRQTFDVFWTAMNEHYAFFELHGVEWQERYALAPDVGSEMPEADLYLLLQEALTGLDDGHLQLVAGDLGFFSPALAPEWVDAAGLSRTELNQLARDSINAPMIPIEDTMIEFTLREDGIGYVLIRGMNVRVSFGAMSEQTTADAFAEVAEELQSASAIIIDIRYNPGGSDAIAFGIASHFIAEPTPVFTKSSRIGDGQGRLFEAVVQPFDNTPLTQPVILLTSRATGSAAEIFTMAMREFPQVTTMGEPTSGGLSDILDFELPNGWSLGLSDQTYLTMDGSLFEAIGIPPDVPMQIDATALSRGQDVLLEAAIAYALEQ